MRTPLLIIVLLGFLSALAAAQDEVVMEIRFEGNRRYTDKFLKEQIATKIGEKLDPALLSKDEKLLREFFAEVRIDDRKVEGGVEVVFRVKDRTVVGKVSFSGLARVKEDDVTPLMITRRGRPLLIFALKNDAELIERLEREQGYHFAKVEYRLKNTKHEGVQDVVFTAYPGRRVKVKKVVLEGAYSLDKSDLLDGAKNSDTYRGVAYSVFSTVGLGGILGPSYFDRTALDQDRRRIELIYAYEGFLDAKVVLVGFQFDEARKFATIHYRIDEGKRYRLGNLTVEWDKRAGAEPAKQDRAFLAAENLVNLATFETGDPYRNEDVRASRRRIQSRLWSRAYANSQVSVRPHEHPETHTVDLTFVIYAGSKVRLGRLRIVGNQYTRDNVIRRQFLDGALPGRPLDLDAVNRGESALRRMRYFSQVARKGRPPHGLLKDPDSERDDEYDLELEVVEQSTRSFNAGAAVSTDGGIVGNFSIDFRNFDIRKPPDKLSNFFSDSSFRGGGQRLVLSASPGSTFSTFEITFVDPAIRDSLWSLRTSVARRVRRYDEYDESLDGVSLSLGRFLDLRQRWHLRGEWKFNNVLISDPEPDAPINALDEQGHTTENGLGVTFAYDRRRELDFIRGYRMTLGGWWYGGLLGAETDIVKLRYTFRKGWRFAETKSGNFHRATVDFSIDWATGYGDTGRVPIWQRYFAGGRNLRGFEFREVGPRSNGSASGGEFRSLLSTQYYIPLTDGRGGAFGLDLVFFVDQGTNVLEFGDVSWDKWRITPGFGLAIKFGGPNQPPLHIDFGWPIQKVDGDKTQVVSFSFRRDF